MTAVSDARHHHATREIIIVPMPVVVPYAVETPAPMEIGSPKVGRIARPAPFERNVLPAWKPATKPPRNKAERFIRFIDNWRKQDAAIREFMKPNAALLRMWLERGAEAALGQIGTAG